MILSCDIFCLIEIMVVLCILEIGCLWDLEQIFQIIVFYILEEVYEVVDVIVKVDMFDLREEFGDFFLQVVYYVCMVEEDRYFDFGDVVEGIIKKMICWYLYVFGDENGEKVDYVKGIWEWIKIEECVEKVVECVVFGLNECEKGFLDDVLVVFLVLQEVEKLQCCVLKVGFDWNDVCLVFDKICEEIYELDEEFLCFDLDKDWIMDELGDMLFVFVNFV